MQSETVRILEDLVRAVMMDDGSWCYCQVCGMEISPIEPDAEWSWCANCHSKVKVDGLRSLGLI